MLTTSWTVQLASLGLLTVASALPSSDSLLKNYKQFTSSNIITRDVVVIGGGSTGTYSATRLRDLGKSVVVIEQKDKLGGHTETYTDPVTGLKADIGVVVWHNTSQVTNFFKRFDVPLAKADFGSGASKFVDFRTGKEVANYTSKSFTAGLAAYTAQLVKYPYVELGFDLPNPVPEDLLLPFGDFVTKYGIQDFVPFLAGFAQGLGNILEQPTLYVFKNFGLNLIENLSTGFLTSARKNNHEVYEKAQAALGADVLLSSTILAVDRDAPDYARIVVQTPTGLKLIQAKKIVFTIPPKIHTLRNFDLDKTESSLFKQFGNSGYYTGLLRDTGFPSNLTIQNVGANTPYNLGVLPGVYGISPSNIPGLMSVKYGAPANDIRTSAQVQADILAKVKLIQGSSYSSAKKPSFAIFSSHTPFELTVPAAAIRAGFYAKLGALQGHRRVWYTGAAFHTHDSALLWQYTESLLPKIVAA